jgi:hypothetical protein
MALVLAAICGATRARAEDVTQSFTLKAGWNAIFLEVEPPNPAIATVFSGVSRVLSVWTWNTRSSPVEFIQNPSAPLDAQPYMLAWFAGNPTISNLSGVSGEAPYLINIGPGADQTWTVTGRPAVPRVQWKANSFNLVGFHLTTTPGTEPLFADFFAASPAHAGQDVYTLNTATGSWVKVSSPAARMKRGEAFWVYCKGSSSYAGPLSVQLESGGLEFGTLLNEQRIVLKNASATARTISVRASSDAAKVHFWKSDESGVGGSWVDLLAAAPPLDSVIPGGGEQQVRLGVVREGMAAGLTYDSNLTFTDGNGVRIVLPATAKGVSTAGLWVGDVLVDKVRYPAGGSPDPTPVGSPFGFRIIVHVDGGGNVRLLREVVQLWQEGTWKSDPADLGHLVVDTPGHYVLVANRSRLGEFRGAALRDGQEVGRRISTSAFGPIADADATGAGSFALQSSLSFALHLAADDPTNPFLHKFHKDHTAADSYAVVRNIALSFGEHDASGNLVSGVPTLAWGSTEVGGVYDEEFSLQSVIGDPPVVDGSDAPFVVKVRGTFRLTRVSDVDTLQL